MKPLYYILKKTIKNTIKNLWKKPWVLFGYILLGLFLLFAVAMSFLVPSRTIGEGNAAHYGLLITVFLIGVAYAGIKQGFESGNSFFRSADVNMVFTAPISPKKVLIYGFIKQMASIITFFVIITGQIPNLRFRFAITDYGILIIYLGVALFFLLMPLIGMLIYSVAAQSSKNRNAFDKGLKAVLALLIISFIAALFQTKDFLEAAVMTFNHRMMIYIPVIGWFKVLLLSAMEGVSAVTYLNLSLIVLTFIGVIYTMYKLKTDYYEDVLAATARKEQLLKSKREGKGDVTTFHTKVGKATQRYGGSGAKTIFYRQLLEYKKTGFFFIDRTTLSIVAIGIASRYLFGGENISALLYFSIYIVFFMTLRGKWAQELEKPFIYLIPSSGSSKVFYATFATIVKSGVDGLVLFAVAGFLYKVDIGIMLLGALVYTTYAAVYTYGDVLFRRVFGTGHSGRLSLLLKMVLILFVVMPGLVISMVCLSVFAHVPFILHYSYMILAGYNLLVCMITLFLSKGMFEKMEMQ